MKNDYSEAFKREQIHPDETPLEMMIRKQGRRLKGKELKRAQMLCREFGQEMPKDVFEIEPGITAAETCTD